MDSKVRGENEFLCQNHSTFTRYGSFTVDPYVNDTFVEHQLADGETIQAIALKYDVPVEKIKRANKLWNNDLLFLRKNLRIPIYRKEITVDHERSEIVDDSPTKKFDMSSENSMCSLNNVSPFASPVKEKNALVKTSRTISDNSIAKNSSNSVCPASSDSELSAKDFLNQYDNKIAKLKSDVAKFNSTYRDDFVVDSPEEIVGLRRAAKFGTTRTKSATFSTDDPFSHPELVVRSRANVRARFGSANHLILDDVYQL